MSKLPTHLQQRQAVWLVAALLFSFTLHASPDFRHEKHVVVQPGETLSEIVQREMRSFVHWPAVAHHNNIQNPAMLQVGQIIRIPLIYTRSEERAVVLFVKGDVRVRRAEEASFEALPRGAQIEVGDEIQTGKQGFVSLEFRSGSVVNIQPDSHVSVVDIACEAEDKPCVIELYAEKGTVQSRVNKPSGRDVKFLINTPSGSAAVRGTVFDTSAQPAKSLTGVLEGQVAVSAGGGGKDVDAGYGIVTVAGEVPGLLKPLLPEPTVKALPNRISPQDRIDWWQDSAAETYELRISSDAAGSDVAFQARQSDSGIRLEIQQGGQHFLTLRAVDTEGFTGLPTVVPVILAQLRSGVSAPSLSATHHTDGAAFSLVNRVAGAIGYEIQVAEDRNFIGATSVDLAIDEDGAYLGLGEGVTLWARARALFPGGHVSQFGEPVSISAH